MLGLDRIAEQRILEAIAKGELRGLEGEGRPLALDDDSAVPEELRLAYRVLRNAGVTPPEVGLRRSIAELERALADGEEGLAEGGKRLSLLRTRLEAGRGGRASLALEREYREKMLRRLTGS